MKKILLSLVGLLLVLSLNFSTQTACAQTTAAEEILNFAPLDYKEINKQLSEIETKLKKNKTSPDGLEEYVHDLSQLSSQILNDKKEEEKELQFAEKRLEALGEAPQDGKELQVIADKRKQFTKEVNEYKARVSEADIALAKIDELDTLILEIRNNALLSHLLDKQAPLIYPQNFFNSNKMFVELLIDIITSPVDWYKELGAEKQKIVKQNALPVTGIIILVALVALYLRVFILRHLGYHYNGKEPVIPYSRKVSAAFFVSMAYGIIPAALIAAALVWIYTSKFLTIGFFGVALNSFLYFLFYIVLGRALTRVTFTPYHEEWRLFNISTDKAKRLTSRFYFFITLICICSYLSHVALKSEYGMDLVYYINAISNAVKGLSIILIVKAAFWDDSTSPETPDSPEDDDDAALKPEQKITLLTSITSIAVFALSLFGYQKLSSFIFNNVLISCIIIGAIFIVHKAVIEFLHHILLMQFWVRNLKLRRKLIDKINFWLTLCVNPIFILVGIFALLSLWGVSTDLLLQSFKKLMFGFKVGDVEISVVAIIFSIAVFFGALTIGKIIRNRIVENVLSHMEMDEGIKHSLASGISFVNFVIAAILAVLMMGGSLGNLALIASALSVGIGLGLQNIVNNFVSGIILLFERPIKVGDWVKIDGEEGKVKQINIRATEVETFNKISVIVPNATLLSTSLRNMTHGNNWLRYPIKVGVAYGSDVDKVKEILLECALAQKTVLRDPAPYVLFQDFGSSSLDFELRIYVKNIWEGWKTPSEIRYAINKRFIEEGIEIPFPQVVVHHGSEVSAETETQFYAAKKKAASPTAKESNK